MSLTLKFDVRRFFSGTLVKFEIEHLDKATRKKSDSKSFCLNSNMRN